MKAKWIWIVLGVAVLVLVGVRLKQRADAMKSMKAETKIEAPLVRAAKVERRTVDETVSLTGTVRPRNEVQVLPKVGGRIETISVEVGDKVKAGQALAVIEHKEIGWQARSADAAVKIAQANLEGAQLDRDRTAALFKSGAATQAQMDGIRVRYALAEAQLAQAQAAAGLANTQLSNATVVSPIDGVVTRRAVDVGAQVGPSSLMFTVQDAAALEVDTSVDAATYARLSRGATAWVRSDSVQEAQPATVKIISPSLDPVSRRADVKLEVDNTAGKLVPNLFVKADVKVGTLQNALVVPRAAVLEAAGGARVFRIKGDAVESLTPKFGPTAGDQVVILEGLNEGDQVAITGLGNLADGTAVRVAKDEARADAAPAPAPKAE